MPGKRQRNGHRVFVRIQIFALETTGSIRVPKRALEASWLGPEIALERKKIITYSIDSFVFVLSSYELKKDSILFFLIQWNLKIYFDRFHSRLNSRPPNCCTLVISELFQFFYKAEM